MEKATTPSVANLRPRIDLPRGNAMKASLYAVAHILLFGLTAFGQGTCSSGDSAQPSAGTTRPPFNAGQPNPSAQEVFEFLSQRPPGTAAGAVSTPLPAAATPKVPAARIRVVDPASVSRPTTSAGNSSQAAATPTARIRVVDDAFISKTTIDSPQDTEPEGANDDAEAAVIAAITPEESTAIDPALSKLIGTWKAVARHGDGELTTVELQLDDRGWAKFTVPSAEGESTTIKRRAELNGEELKLTGPDANLLLGTLIEVTDRQMVLARAEGKLTFVRPQ
jgi:hypothetical protein